MREATGAPVASSETAAEPISEKTENITLRAEGFHPFYLKKRDKQAVIRFVSGICAQ